METANHISLAGSVGQTAIAKAREYVNAASGEEFVKKTKLAHLTITYVDSIDIFRKRHYNPHYSASKCGNVKYCVYLRFTPQPESSLLIAVPMNDKFELTEPLHLPDREKNPDFDKIIPREKAYKIARKKYGSLLKNAESIALQYDDDINSFVWEIDSDQKYIELFKFEYWTIKVDAVTGRIVGSQMKITTGHNTRFF